MVEKGERGTVIAIEHGGVSVRFTAPEGDVLMPRASLKRYAETLTPDKASKRRKGASGAKPIAEYSQSESSCDVAGQLILWVPNTLDDMTEHIKGHIRGLLLHLVGSDGPKMHDIGFTSPHSSPIALREFQPGELKLFPHGRCVSERKPDGGSFIILRAGVSDTKPQDFYIAAPGLSTEGAAPEPGQMQCVWAFWNAVAAAGHQQQSPHTKLLEYTTHTFSVNLQMVPKAQGKPGEEKKDDTKLRQTPRILITVPYLVNSVVVPRGHSEGGV